MQPLFVALLGLLINNQRKEKKKNIQFSAVAWYSFPAKSSVITHIVVTYAYLEK